jgi:hypothetical protein
MRRDSAATLAACNAASDYISGKAWESKTFRQFDLHRLCYREARNRFGITVPANSIHPEATAPPGRMLWAGRVRAL